MSQAVPKAFNLELEKPVTVPAYGRQVQSVATNAQSFGPNTIANIVIDTSTPGSFLDTNQSCIEFDVTFTNTNPHIDNLNFGATGAASLIQEYRIYNQGTPLVEILDYNLAFETWLKLNNVQQQEFKMYMENSWRAPVANDESDLNFVKPPMVDLNGVIMWPTTVNQFGDSNTHAKKSIGHYLSIASTQAGVAADILAGKMAGGEFFPILRELTEMQLPQLMVFLLQHLPKDLIQEFYQMVQPQQLQLRLHLLREMGRSIILTIIIQQMLILPIVLHVERSIYGHEQIELIIPTLLGHPLFVQRKKDQI